VAAPVAALIKLPDDSGNTGKQVRTQTRVIGGQTVHEHYFVPSTARSRLGVYYAASGTLTIPTTAQNGTTTGLFWLFNPVGSGRNMAVRRFATQIQFALMTAIDVSVPRLAFNLFTLTGTASGAAVTAARRTSADPAPVGNLRTASTGLTITLGAMLKSDFPPINASATSAAALTPAYSNDWDPPEEEQPILLPGEGIVCWSADASTTANKRTSTDLVWEEFEP
jgi:hypothetical protein